MKITDDDVMKLYGFDTIVGDDQRSVYVERNVKVLENPYSLSDEGPKSMFKIQNGGRRSRKVSRRRRKGTRRSRNH
jgi:hypothetical protein